MKVEISINKKKYKVVKNRSLLDILRKNEIEVAALCNHPNFKDFAKKDSDLTGHSVCRLCMIKAKLKNDKTYKLVPSCRLKAVSGLKVITDDEEIARLRKTNLELLFADHAGLCVTCQRNMDCELQTMAIKFNIDAFRFVPKISNITDKEELDMLMEKMSKRVVDRENPCISRDSMKCIKCRRCIKVCKFTQTVDAYGMSDKNHRAKVTTEYNKPLECTYCGQCTVVCPTAALTVKNDIKDFIIAVKDKKKHVVVQTAPSVRVALGEEFKMSPGTIVTGKMVKALREAGADNVFDTNFAADLTIMEEATEFIDRFKNKTGSLPIFTSCCPAWVLFLEQNYPEFIPHLSSAKSPQMMMGSLIKSYWAKQKGLKKEDVFSVSVMPCIAKKYEIERKEYQSNGIKDVDIVLTTRELGKLLRLEHINLPDLEDSKYDQTLGISSSAGAIFGQSGGVTEAALRTAHYLITGKELEKLEFKAVRGSKNIKTTEAKIANNTFKIKVVHGLGNARKVLDKLKTGYCDFDFLEVMACPGGCIGGGGQPIPTSPKIRKKRVKAILSLDTSMKLRQSHNNPMIKELYDKFLAAPGSRKAHKYLHTKNYPYKYKWKD